MIKKFMFALVVILGLSSKANAFIEVSDVTNDTFTVVAVKVTSGTPVAISSNTFSNFTVMTNRKIFELQNVDPAVIIYCKEGGSGAGVGTAHLISPNGGVWALNITDRDQNGSPLMVNCISSAVTAGPNLVISQFRAR